MLCLLPRPVLVLLLCLCCFQSLASGYQDTVDVSATIHLIRRGKPSGHSSSSAGVVVWLTRLSSSALDPVSVPIAGRFRLVQKDKTFTPHLLVVPTGSSVEFPNLDPFFHNVFSTFNGKRFDLGLYESGSTRTVRFDHEGVSYIFCNIHPEMSAVVVALSTPYFGISQADGSITLHAVPPGTYEMQVWAEGSNPQDLSALTRRIVVTPTQKNLGMIDVTVESHLPPHKNKFGEDYKAPEDSLY
jgi:plastocyanin